MEKTAANTFLGFRKPSVGASPKKSDHLKGDKFIRDNLVISLRARILAIAFFLYLFIEAGTLGLLSEKTYIVYRNVRISDFIMIGLVVYSFLNIREYVDLFKSKAFFVTKVFLAYLVFEFLISFIRYDFNILEYAFRLKGLWGSFLVFPYLLLHKRGGVSFLFKLMIPVAIISNTLYILTALTGIAFLPDVSIVTQILPGDITIYRVYGGTFFGETFFLAIVYLWITHKFRVWQIFLAILFITPHVLAFGRNAWAYFIFAIVIFIIINILNKKEFRVIFRQAVIIALLIAAFIVSFLVFIPESGYYVEALSARITQGQDDVKYNEGTYGTRVLFQNNSLVRLWLNSDVLLGIGMHPMWVVKPESFEEQVYYNAFCDVSWPSVLAAYGLIGFFLAVCFQVYYIFATWRLVKKARAPNIQTFLLTLIFVKLTFDTFINFSYVFVSAGLWGIFPVLNFFVAVVVYNYEKQKAIDNQIAEKTT